MRLNETDESGEPGGTIIWRAKAGEIVIWGELNENMVLGGGE